MYRALHVALVVANGIFAFVSLIAAYVAAIGLLGIGLGAPPRPYGTFLSTVAYVIGLAAVGTFIWIAYWGPGRSRWPWRAQSVPLLLLGLLIAWVVVADRIR